MNLRREVVIFMVQICPLLVHGEVSLARTGSQVIGGKLALICTISNFTGTASWAKDESVLSTCTILFCSPEKHENVTTFLYGNNYIEVAFDPVDSSIFGEWTCTHSSGIESFNVTGSPPITTEQQTTTDETTMHETTTANTNDGPKDNVIIIIGAALGVCVLSGLIILIVFVIKRRNQRDTKTPKKQISNGTLDPNYTDPSANMAMQHR